MKTKVKPKSKSVQSTPDAIRAAAIANIVKLADLIDDVPDTLKKDIEEADPFKDDGDLPCLLVETDVSTWYLYHLSDADVKKLKFGSSDNEFVLELEDNALVMVEV